MAQAPAPPLAQRICCPRPAAPPNRHAALVLEGGEDEGGGADEGSERDTAAIAASLARAMAAVQADQDARARAATSAGAGSKGDGGAAAAVPAETLRQWQQRAGSALEDLREESTEVRSRGMRLRPCQSLHGLEAAWERSLQSAVAAAADWGLPGCCCCAAQGRYAPLSIQDPRAYFDWAGGRGGDGLQEAEGKQPGDTASAAAATAGGDGGKGGGKGGGVPGAAAADAAAALAGLDPWALAWPPCAPAAASAVLLELSREEADGEALAEFGPVAAAALGRAPAEALPKMLLVRGARRLPAWGMGAAREGPLPATFRSSQ